MGSSGLFTQRLVLIDVFETGQRLFAVKADIVRKGLNDLKKILDDMSITLEKCKTHYIIFRLT